MLHTLHEKLQEEKIHGKETDEIPPTLQHM